MNIVFNVVQKYKTFDGKEFESASEAEKHTIDKVCEEIDGILLKIDRPNFTRIDAYHIILALTGDLQKIKDLQKIVDVFTEEPPLELDY